MKNRAEEEDLFVLYLGGSGGGGGSDVDGVTDVDVEADPPLTGGGPITADPSRGNATTDGTSSLLAGDSLASA